MSLRTPTMTADRAEGEAVLPDDPLFPLPAIMITPSSGRVRSIREIHTPRPWQRLA